MARRRGFAAIGSNLQQLAQLLYQNQLMMERQAAEDALIRNRQKEAADYGHKLDLQERDYQLGIEKQKNVAGLPQRMNSVKNVAELPTKEGIISELQANDVDVTPDVRLTRNATPEGGLPSRNYMPTSQPGIQTLYDQLDARKRAIGEEDNRQLDLKLAEAFGKKREEGRAEEQNAQDFFSGQTQRKVEQTRQVGNMETAVAVDKEKRLQPVRISTAGGESRAREQARLDVLNDPKNVAKEVNRQTQLAAIDVLKTGNVERAKFVEQTRQGAVKLAPVLGQLEKLYDQAVKGNVQAMRLYDQLKEANAATFANFAGDNGRLSDQDLERAGYNLPNITDVLLGGPELGRDKFRKLKALIVVRPRLAAELDPTVDPATYVQRAEQLMTEIMSTQAGKPKSAVTPDGKGGFKVNLGQ